MINGTPDLILNMEFLGKKDLMDLLDKVEITIKTLEGLRNTITNGSFLKHSETDFEKYSEHLQSKIQLSTND